MLDTVPPPEEWLPDGKGEKVPGYLHNMHSCVYTIASCSWTQPCCMEEYLHNKSESNRLHPSTASGRTDGKEGVCLSVQLLPLLLLLLLLLLKLCLRRPSRHRPARASKGKDRRV